MATIKVTFPCCGSVKRIKVFPDVPRQIVRRKCCGQDRELEITTIKIKKFNDGSCLHVVNEI